MGGGLLGRWGEGSCSLLLRTLRSLKPFYPSSNHLNHSSTTTEFGENPASVFQTNCVFQPLDEFCLHLIVCEGKAQEIQECCEFEQEAVLTAIEPGEREIGVAEYQLVAEFQRDLIEAQ